MAISGLAMVGFLVAHLAGNLLVFAGPEAINKYAVGLRDLGALLWILRGGIVLFFVLHIVEGITLKMRNNSARPVAYSNNATIQASFASRTMALTGMALLAYVIFHLLHFTWGAIQPQYAHASYVLDNGRIVHDVYSMVVHAFNNPLYTVIYLLSIGFVLLHLSHALSSSFQTLGAFHPKFNGIIKTGSMGLAILLWLGYSAIPLGIAFGLAKLEM